MGAKHVRGSSCFVEMVLQRGRTAEYDGCGPTIGYDSCGTMASRYPSPKQTILSNHCRGRMMMRNGKGATWPCSDQIGRVELANTQGHPEIYRFHESPDLIRDDVRVILLGPCDMLLV